MYSKQYLRTRHCSILAVGRTINGSCPFRSVPLEVFSCSKKCCLVARLMRLSRSGIMMPDFQNGQGVVLTEQCCQLRITVPCDIQGCYTLTRWRELVVVKYVQNACWLGSIFCCIVFHVNGTITNILTIISLVKYKRKHKGRTFPKILSFCTDVYKFNRMMSCSVRSSIASRFPSS